ncbi:MAG: hypothetical protein ACE5KT_10765, partial [Methanosarcinales archaeon]
LPFLEYLNFHTLDTRHFSEKLAFFGISELRIQDNIYFNNLHFALILIVLILLLFITQYAISNNNYD